MLFFFENFEKENGRPPRKDEIKANLKAEYKRSKVIDKQLAIIGSYSTNGSIQAFT